MKLKNVFKKVAKNTISSKVETLDRKQLEKVLGGTEGVKNNPLDKIGGTIKL